MKKLLVWLASAFVCTAQAVSIGPFATETWVEDKLKDVASVTNGLASVSYVDDLIDEVEASIPDVSGFATKSYVDAVSNAIPSVAGLATIEQVTAVSNLLPDVTYFATRQWVGQSITNAVDDLVVEWDSVTNKPSIVTEEVDPTIVLSNRTLFVRNESIEIPSGGVGTEQDPIFKSWADDNTNSLLKTEVDPSFTNWLATTNAVIYDGDTWTDGTRSIDPVDTATKTWTDGHEWTWASITNKPDLIVSVESPASYGGTFWTDGSKRIDPSEVVTYSVGKSAFYTQDGSNLLRVVYCDNSGKVHFPDNFNTYLEIRDIATFRSNGTNWLVETSSMKGDTVVVATIADVDSHKWDWVTQVTNAPAFVESEVDPAFTNWLATTNVVQYSSVTGIVEDIIDYVAEDNFVTGVKAAEDEHYIYVCGDEFRVEDFTTVVTNATAGNIAAIDTNGNLIDSGVSTNLYLRRTGGTMAGPLDMANYSIHQVSPFGKEFWIYPGMLYATGGHQLEFTTNGVLKAGTVATEEDLFGFVDKSYVDSHQWDWSTQVTNAPDFVKESVTNGLASTNWVQAQDNAIWSQLQAHSHSNIVAGDTRIQVVNGGGAKIIQTKNALSRVTLPSGWTVKNASDEVVYETQSGEVMLFNPKRIPSTQYNQDFWLPYGYEDVETWEDIGSTYQGWVVCSMSHGGDPAMVVKTDIRLMLQISNGTLTPMGSMTASGGSPVYENDIPYDEIEDIARVSDIPNHYVEAVNGIEGRVQIGLLGEDPTFMVTPEYTNGLKLATFAFTNGWEQIQVWPEGVSGGGPESVSGVQFDVYFPTSAIPDVSSFVSADAIAPAWQQGSYTNGDFVIYNTHLYECTNMTSGVWTPADWKQTSVTEILGNLRKILDAINGEAL